MGPCTRFCKLLKFWPSGNPEKYRYILEYIYSEYIYSVRTRIFHYRTNVTYTIIIESLWIYKLL